MEDNNYIENSEVSTQNVPIQREPIEMTFWQGIKAAFARSFDFKGRARRKEFWSFYVFYFLIVLVSTIFAVIIADLYRVEHSFLKLFIIPAVIILVLFIPTISVTIRRFHDIGKSCALPLILMFAPGIIQTPFIVLGFYTKTIAMIFSFLGLLCNIILYIYLFRDGKRFENKYGKDPKFEE